MFIGGEKLKESKLIIMLHGFSGNPYNFYFMKRFFEKEGYEVWVPMLLGHKDEDDFNKYIAIEWYEDIKKRIYEKIKKNNYDKIYLAGLSMGGAFAIRLSVELNVFDALILLAAPLSLKLKNQLLLTVFGFKLLNRFMPVIEKKESDISKDLQRQINKNFNYISIRSVFGLSYFLKENKKYIPQVKIPALIIHSRKDHTIPYKHAKKIYKKISSKVKKIILLGKSYHIIPLDVERDYVFEIINEFLNGLNKDT